MIFLIHRISKCLNSYSVKIVVQNKAICNVRGQDSEQSCAFFREFASSAKRAKRKTCVN